MLIWLLSNICLSLIALLFIYCNGSTPHRLRLYVLVTALIAWLVPWQQLTFFMPEQFFTKFGTAVLPATLQRSAEYLQSVQFVLIQSGSAVDESGFVSVSAGMLVLSALSLIGLVLFMIQLFRHHRELRKLQHESADGASLWEIAGVKGESTHLKIQRRVSGAFSTGLFRPCIWVHQNLTASEQLNTLLQHELTNVRQHDNSYLMLVTFLEKLFWWNPLVRYLGSQARELVELSCDENCKAQDKEYPVRLASLILQNIGGCQSSARALVSANIFGKNRVNIRRIKSLQRNYAMKKRHIVSGLISLAAAFGCVAYVSAQADSESDMSTEKHGFFLRGFIAHETDGNTQEAGHSTVRVVDTVAPYLKFQPLGEQGQHFIDMTIGKTGEEPNVTMKFADTQLTSVLIPMALMVKYQLGEEVALHGAAIGGAVLPASGMTANSTAVTLAIPFEPGQKFTLDNSAEAKHKLLMQKVYVYKGEQMDHAPAVFPDNIILEDQLAADRLVNVEVDASDLDDALDQIGAAAGCNIFRENGNIVVDYCD